MEAARGAHVGNPSVGYTLAFHVEDFTRRTGRSFDSDHLLTRPTTKLSWRSSLNSKAAAVGRPSSLASFPRLRPSLSIVSNLFGRLVYPASGSKLPLSKFCVRSGIHVWVSERPRLVRLQAGLGIKSPTGPSFLRLKAVDCGRRPNGSFIRGDTG